MGLIGKWKEFRTKQDDKSAAKHGETLKRKITTKEQRMEAIEALASMDPTVSLPQLLKRFELVVDHGIQDNREKEMVEKVFLEHKEQSRSIIREAVLKAERVAWPIRLAEKLFEEEEYKSLLLEGVVTQSALFDEIVLERNVELLLALREMPDDRVVERAAALLGSRDENVRMAALECLEFQGETSVKAKETVLALLQDPSTESNARLQGLLKTIVKKHSWSADAPR